MKDQLSNRLWRNAPLAFKQLHKVFGMDFEKPYGIGYFDANYTVAKILAAATKDGYQKGDLLVLITRVTRAQKPSYWYFATVSESGRIETDYRLTLPHPSFNAGKGLATFHTKTEFEEIRKDRLAEVYFLWQSPQYLRFQRKRPCEEWDRFKIHNCEYCSFADYTFQSGKRYVSRLVLQRTDGQGELFEYRVAYRRVICDGRPKDGTTDAAVYRDIIDKSGYLLMDDRKKLKERAYANRAKREKAAFVAADFHDQVAHLESLIVTKKVEITQQLVHAQTFAEIKAVASALSYPYGLAGIQSSFEEFKEKTENKSYPSIAACEQAYQHIIAQLENYFKKEEQ